MSTNEPPTALAVIEIPTVTLAVPQPASQNPAVVYLASLAPSSRRTMGGALDKMAAILTGGRETRETLQWGQLRATHTLALRARLADEMNAATANRHLAALRGVLKAAWRLEQMSGEDYARAIDVKGVKGETLPRGRSLDKSERVAISGACAADTHPITGTRDAALLGVLYGTGVRRSEAVALDLSDFDARAGKLTVKHGKGNKAREVFMGRATVEALDAWLRLRGDAPGPLFLAVTKGHGIEAGRRLTAEGVRFILGQRAAQAGVAACSPHDLRRSFVSDLLDKGADISTVSKMAGHANLATTQRYDKRGDLAKRAAAELLDMAG